MGKNIKTCLPITLLSEIYIFFTKDLMSGLESILNSVQPREETALRSGFSGFSMMCHI